MGDVKLEHSTEVIVPSDNMEKLPSESSLFVAGTFDEEVNSPVTFPRGPVRRKLFDEEHPIMDMESSTNVLLMGLHKEAVVVPTHPLGGCHIFTNERRKQGDKSPHVTHTV
ncbi:hypothetical protein SASPL_136171 [Salvia splendens]|uniref:Uncharacterized protein n=1 Tax=Salvia splendens TaxID=180675 RepID=A0A8X8ZGE2_SALSN|nr:hypothetical protein SASPL_136171 [Salvia splendens]